jgi:arsenate reductase (thioredoxin)
MLKIMFLCTGNACRSQMAEAFARELSGGMIDAYSAGLMEVELLPRAVAAMKEAGIDITGQKSKEIDPELLSKMEVVITLCKPAEDNCPSTPPQVKRLHWPIVAPVETEGMEEVTLNDFRRARDEIRGLVEQLIRKIEKAESL